MQIVFIDCLTISKLNSEACGSDPTTVLPCVSTPPTRLFLAEGKDGAQ